MEESSSAGQPSEKQFDVFEDLECGARGEGVPANRPPKLVCGEAGLGQK